MRSIAWSSAAAVLMAAACSAQNDAELAAPVRLEAGGAVIDMVADIGHAGPMLRDHDGDGKADLLVSAFRGSIHFFRNVGEPGAPRFAAGELLEAAGAPIRIHNW